MLTNSAVNSSYDARDYHICAATELPASYKCPVTVRVKNQGSKPTCTAHATASVVEYHYKRQHDNTYKSFSTEFIYGFRDVGYYVGDGMCIRDALKTIQKYGDCFKTDCPGNNDVDKAMNTVSSNIDKYKELAYPNRVSSYYRCKTIDEIKTALVTHGPVLASMNTYNGAKIVDDVYTYDPEADHGRHCVMIYGYDDRGWLVQNSWGDLWAGDGRFTLPYDYNLNEAWGVSDDILEDNVVSKPSKLPAFIYKLFNHIVNWFMSLKKDS